MIAQDYDDMKILNVLLDFFTVFIVIIKRV